MHLIPNARARTMAVRGVVLLVALALFGGAQTFAWAAANASLSPTSADFGTVNVGSSSAAQVFTITNTGNTNLNIQGVLLSGANANQFSVNTSGMAAQVNAGGSTTFSVTFSPTSAGAKTASVDITTNANNPSASLSGTGGDTTPPTVSLTTSASEPTGTSPIPVTVTFSESVSGFTAGDVTATNGSVSNFAGSGAAYTFDLVPSAAGQVTATVPANSATDGGGNGNTESNTLSRTYSPNAAPTISNIANQTIDEDSTTGALAFTVGDAETAAGSLSVSGSSDNTTLVPDADIVFGGSGANRSVTVTPAPDQSGSATITVTVSDGSLDATDTFTLTVDAVNDAPTISDIANQTIGEDSTTGALAFTVGDAETAAGSLTVSGSSDDTTLVPNGDIVFGGSGANRTVTVTPAANQTGSATITVTVSDGSLDASDTFLVTVNAGNDPPTISDIANQTIDEDSDTGALAFTVGDDETPAGSLTVSGSSDDTTLVPNGNIVFGGSGATRTVTVTPAADQSGSATITVTVSDGALDISDTFVLTVNAVNDQPSFTKGPDQTVGENAGPQTLAGWASAISAGPADESGQALSFVVSNDDPGLFSAQPAVSPTGTLTYTPAPNTTGSATVTVTLQDDGGTANGGDDTSPPQTFTITVSAGSVNTPPVANDDAASTAVNTPVASIDVLANDTDADDDALSVGAFDAASAQGGTVACAATCSYTPPAGFVGTDTFGYTADDGNGGTDDATVTVQVQASAPVANQPPSLHVSPATQTVQHSDAIAVVSIVAWDPEGRRVRLAVTGLPLGVSFTDSGNGRGTLQGLAFAPPGTYVVHVVASDDAGAQTTATARITVVSEDVLVRYTGQHLVFTEPGSLGEAVMLRARLTDISAQTDTPSGLLRPWASADVTVADVSGSTVTFMEGEQVLCGPVPVRLAAAPDTAVGIATCGARVYLPLGSHDVDVRVDGNHAFAGRVGQVEIDRATLNYLAGGGAVTPYSSAGELPADEGSSVSFGFRVRYNPTRTKVLGHANVLFVSGGETYQVRSRRIGSVVSGPGAAFARFETTATLSDVTEPLSPDATDTDLRLVVWVADRLRARDQIAIAVYRGDTLVFASRWNGAPVLRNLSAGRILIR